MGFCCVGENKEKKSNLISDPTVTGKRILLYIYKGMVENTTETAFAFGFRNKRPIAVVAAFSRWYFTAAARGHQPSANSITSCERRSPPLLCVVHAGQPL